MPPRHHVCAGAAIDDHGTADARDELVPWPVRTARWLPSERHNYIFMASNVMAYMAMAYILMAYIVMAYVGMDYTVMAPCSYGQNSYGPMQS